MKTVQVCLGIIAFILMRVGFVSEIEATERITEEKVYCTATIEEEFSDNSVIVVINKSSSRRNFQLTSDDFTISGIETIEKLTNNASL